MQKKSGELVQKQGKGTPQGGVISPLPANLFLHYVMDKWLELNHPAVKFVRYADDAILHCRSKTHAEQTLNAVRERMNECVLELHPEKTKIVYCKDYRRQEKHENVKFDFLGYSFQPRTTKSQKTGKLFLGYDCAISISSKKPVIAKAIGTLGKEKVQTLQNQCKPCLYMVRKSAGSISYIILPLANWFIKLKRLDLYNKSRMMGDYQVRFCERIRVKLPLLTRRQTVMEHNKNSKH